MNETILKKNTVQHNKERLILLEYAKPDTLRSIFEYSITFFFLFFNSYLLFNYIDYNALLTVALMVLQALILSRIFVIQHDCGHNTLFKNNKLNNALGVLCSLMTPMTYHYWRYTHALHHKTNNNLDYRPWVGAVEVLTTDEYLRSTETEKKLYKLKSHIITIVVFGWIFHFFNYRIFLNHKNIDKSIITKKIWLQVYISNLVQVILFVLITQVTSIKFLFLAFLIPMIFTYCIGIFMFFVQHNFEQSYFYSNVGQEFPQENFKKAALEGSSCFLQPGILRWFMANSGYHHIHHVSPRIPFYKLKKIYDSHPELRQAYVVTMKTAIKQFSYKLYYPEWNKMITWKEYNLLEKELTN